MSLLRRLKRRLKFGESKSVMRKKRAALEHMLGIVHERPLNINIETTSVCNSRCCFCAYPKVRREPEQMRMELFNTILDEYEEIGGGPIGFSPLLSDPLTDQSILEKIQIATDEKRKFWVHMFTNAIGFSRFNDAEMRMFALLRHINISMGGPDRESYALMYGVDSFDRVVENISRLHAVIKESGSDTKISMHFRVNNKEALLQSELYKQCVHYGFECLDIATKFTNFGGIVTQNDVPDGVSILQGNNRKRSEGCLIPFAECTICPNGDVVMCSCFDYNGSTVAGNLTENRLVDIWANDCYKQFRTCFIRNDVADICKNCSSYTPVEQTLSHENLRDYDPKGKTFWEYLK